MTRTDSSNPRPSAVGESTQFLPDGDVSPQELWGALSGRRSLILTILVISLISAGLFIFFTPPVYESRAVLQMGYIGQIGQIEAPAVLTKRLMVQDDVDGGKTAIDRARPFILAAFLEKDTNLISIIARGPAPDVTQKYLAQIVARVIHEHQELFDLARKEQQQFMNKMQTLGQDIDQAIAANDLLNSSEKETGTRVRQSVRADASSALRVNHASVTSKLLEQRNQAELMQKDLRMAMLLHSKPTTVIKAPTLAAESVKPRPLVYLAFAVVIGLILGIFSVVVIEFIGKVRRSASS